MCCRAGGNTVDGMVEEKAANASTEWGKNIDCKLDRAEWDLSAAEARSILSCKKVWFLG